MIIMQTEDARKRREYIECGRLAKVIFSHEFNDSLCVQYHPRGIKGTMSTSLRDRKISLRFSD